MAFDRIFRHYDTDFTLIGDLNGNLVEHADFELLRQGGCGQGNMTLAEDFPTDTLTVGQHIQFLYDNSNPWFLGRIEEIRKSSPSGTTVRLYGWVSYLNDLALGGRGKADASEPIIYSDDDYFVSDPDFEEQTRVDTASIEAVVTDIFDNFVDTSTPVPLADIDTPSGNDVMKSMVFRGEENCAQIIRSLAVQAGWCSWGVNEQGIFFFKNLPVSTTHTYQEGVDVEDLTETTDRSLMFNRIILTGGPIYGTGSEHGFYHYRKNVVHWPSRATYGEKKISIHMPWIRTDTDAQKFCEAFFSEYAGLSVRYDFSVSGETVLPKPWAARVALLDYAGNTLKNAVPLSLKVQFDRDDTTMTFHLGPEELQFPSDSHPQRYEDFSPTDLGDGFAFNCEGLTDPLAPAEGWGSTWDCDHGAWVFGVTNETIAAGPIIGAATVTECKKLEYDPDTDTLALADPEELFDMRTFDPQLDGTATGSPVICRKINGKYWGLWVGCEEEEEEV